MSFAPSQSTRELGLRMAPGAEGSDLLRMVMRYGIELALAGIAVGAGSRPEQHALCYDRIRLGGTGCHPRHSMTGRRGYFGSSGCVHRRNVEPRSDRTTTAR